MRLDGCWEWVIDATACVICGFACREAMNHQLDRLAVSEMVPVKRCFVVCVELFIHSFRKVGVDT